MLGATLVRVASRVGFLRRMFPPGVVLLNAVRAMLPGAVAGLVVLGVREAEQGTRAVPSILVEAALFVAVAGTLTFVSERALIRECTVSLHGRGEGIVPAGTAPR